MAAPIPQGYFTPGALNSGVVPVPLGAQPGDQAYLHGMTWIADAPGWLRGQMVNENDIVYAVNWGAQTELLLAGSMSFEIGMQGGFPLSLDCHQLVVRLDLRNPNVPEYGDIGLWDISEWDNVDSPSFAIWASTWDAWTDISDFIRGVRIQVGRVSAWDDIQVGSATIEVDNSEGYFSALSDNGLPRFQLNTGLYIGVIWRGVEYPQFTGGIREFNEDDEPGQTGATFVAYDESSRLTDSRSADYSPGAPEDLASARINKLLDMADLPKTTRRYIQPGTATMTNYKSQRTLLDEIRLTAKSDGGAFYVDAEGVLTYLNRNRLAGIGGIAPPYFSDDCEGVSLPYAAVELTWNDYEFGNVIIMSNVSQGTESPRAVVVSDSASIDKFGSVSWSPSQLVITNADDLEPLARWELARRFDQWYRVNKFEVYPAHDDRIWRACLNMRLYSPLSVQRTPPGNTEPIAAEFLCDGKIIEGTPEMWKFTVYCSKASDIYGRRYGDLNYGEDLYGKFVN